MQPHALEETALHPSLRSPTVQPHDAGPSYQVNFRHRLAASLFRKRNIHFLRLKLAVARFCSVSFSLNLSVYGLESEMTLFQSVQGSVASPFASLADEFSNDIIEAQLQTVIRHMGEVVSFLEGNI